MRGVFALLTLAPSLIGAVDPDPSGMIAVLCRLEPIMKKMEGCLGQMSALEKDKTCEAQAMMLHDGGSDNPLSELSNVMGGDEEMEAMFALCEADGTGNRRLLTNADGERVRSFVLDQHSRIIAAVQHFHKIGSGRLLEEEENDSGSGPDAGFDAEKMCSAEGKVCWDKVINAMKSGMTCTISAMSEFKPVMETLMKALGMAMGEGSDESDGMMMPDMDDMDMPDFEVYNVMSEAMCATNYHGKHCGSYDGDIFAEGDNMEKTCADLIGRGCCTALQFEIIASLPNEDDDDDEDDIDLPALLSQLPCSMKNLTDKCLTGGAKKIFGVVSIKLAGCNPTALDALDTDKKNMIRFAFSKDIMAILGDVLDDDFGKLEMGMLGKSSDNKCQLKFKCPQGSEEGIKSKLAAGEFTYGEEAMKLESVMGENVQITAEVDASTVEIKADSFDEASTSGGVIHHSAFAALVGLLLLFAY